VTISGGTVSATTTYAVYNSSTGKITVSGTAKVTSANTNSSYGTIYNSSNGTIEIIGGTVENTAADANARAIYNYSSTGAVNLGKSPAITGRIFIAAGELRVIADGENAFSPVSKVYSIGFGQRVSTGDMAVKNGANYASNFNASVYDNGVKIDLAASGSDLVFSSFANGYSVSSSGAPYMLAKGTGTYIYVQDAIDFIKTQSSGANCSIKFGDGTNALDIGTEYIAFDGASPAWGLITLAGKIKSASTSYGTIYLSNGASIASTADIANTSSGNAVRNNGAGAVTISGGEVKATTSTAVYNSSTGAVTISGGTVSATTGYAVYNSSTGKITVSGTAKVTSANTSSTSGTIYIASSGTATEERLAITGGTVENTADNGNAIRNNSTGAVTISGGKVLAKGGYAVAKASTGTTTLTGGIVFAYGAAADNVIYGDYTASGNPAIVAWDNTKGTTAYTVSSKTDIFAPSPTTAQWLKKDGIDGIDYANGANTGFIPIDGITVNANTPILSQIAGGNIRVQATANAITLENLPRNTKVQVYTLQGKQIHSANSGNSQILKIQVQTKGVYIVKAGNQTLRVAVR